MKLRHLILFGLIGAGTYSLYQNRQQLRAGFRESKERLDLAKKEVHNIKANLQVINEQKEKTNVIMEDLAYQFRIFQQESKPVLRDIQERLAKYQTSENSKT